MVRMLILGLRANGAHRVTVEASVVDKIPVIIVEVEAVRMAVVARILRTRPVAADVTCAVEVIIPAIAGGREENLTAARTRHKDTIDPIDSCPLFGAIIA